MSVTCGARLSTTSDGSSSGSNSTDCIVRLSSGKYAEESCEQTAHVICEVMQDRASLALAIAQYNASALERCFDDDEQCATWAMQGRCNDVKLFFFINSRTLLRSDLFIQ